MITDEHTDNLLRDGKYWIGRIHIHLSREAGERGVAHRPQGQQADRHRNFDTGPDQEAVA